MSTLAPQLRSNVDYERPVGAAPSVLEAVLGTVTGLASDALTAQANKKGPSAKELENQALAPLIAEMERISDLGITQQEKNRQTNQAYRSWLQAGNGAYSSAGRAIVTGDYGFDMGGGDFQRTNFDNITKWTTESASGRAAAAMVAQQVGQGNVSPEQSYALLEEQYLDHLRVEASVERTALEAKDDETKFRALEGDWQDLSSRMATSTMVSASTNPDLLKDPVQAMDVLDDQIRAVRDQIRTQGRSAGMSSNYLESRIEQLVAPLMDLKAVYQSEMENPGKLLEAVRASDELGLRDHMVGTFGIMGTDPEFRKAFLTWMTTQNYTTGQAQAFMNSVKEGGPTRFDLGVDVPPGVSTAVTTQGAVAAPEKVSEYRQRIKDNPDLLAADIKFAGSKLTSDDPASVQDGINRLVLAGEANTGPIGINTLRSILTPDAMNKVKLLPEADKANLASFIVTQVRHHRAFVAGQGDMLLRDQKVVMENGQFKVYRKGMVDGQWHPRNDNSELVKSVNAVNYLMSMAGRIPEISSKVSKTVNWLYHGVEPTAEMIDSDDSGPELQLDNVQHVSYQAPNNLVALIDKTEGGGRYDTLFMHSQRDGNPFAGVDVSTMSIGQVLEFANPSGPYGQWVKGEIGRVATPMGRYQYVGTTLAQMVEEMGIPLNTTFNAATQDAIFDYHVRKIIAGKSDKAAAQALRGTWEGFQSIGDAELANAVAAFRGTPARDYQSLPTGGAVTPSMMATAAVMGGAGPEGRPAGLGSLNGFEVSARDINAGTARSQVADTSDEGSAASRMNTEMMRRTIAATLQAAGQEATDEQIAAILEKLQEQEG